MIAAEEMFERTDHHLAPWDVISGEQKRFARVRVVETAIHRVEQGMVALGHGRAGGGRRRPVNWRRTATRTFHAQR